MTPPNSPDSEARDDAAADLKLVASAAAEVEPSEESGPLKPPEAGSATGTESAEITAGVAEAEPLAEESTEESGAGEGRSRGILIWLLLLVFVAFALALTWQVREGRRLEAEVLGLEQELTQTRAQLRAHQGHLSEIRSSIHAVADRFDALRSLVDLGPGSSAASPSRSGGGQPAASAASGESSHSIPARLPER